jgi:hypothetical protein
MAMKLYVWCDPYGVRYGNSMVFAIAENLEAAKVLAASGTAYRFGEFEQPKNPGAVLGEPTRIVDVPCAEWHEWQE